MERFTKDELEKWWHAQCPKCGWDGLSRDCEGGEPIADTGDFNDPICPMCAQTGRCVVVDDYVEPDAQATIAALQARVQELEAIKIPDDAFTYCAYCGEKSPVDEHNEDLAAHIKVCPKHPMRELESQLTQRTAELEAATRKVGLAEKKAWLAAHDVGFFSMWNGTDHSGPPKLALLCNDTFAWATADAEDVLDEQIDTIVELFKTEGEAGVIKWIAQQRNMKPMESVGKWLFGCDAIKKQRDDLQAELERVRALIKTYADAKIDFDDKRLQEDHHAWRERYNKLVEAENALLQHRQGMEG